MQGPVIESGVQLFSRISHSSDFSLNDLNPRLFQYKVPPSKAIIEVAGEFSYNLLIDFLARCILPTELNSEWKGFGVIFVNTTHHVNILKITSVVDSMLKHFNVKSRKSVVEKALSHITMLPCYDDQQLEFTLRNLDRTIRDRQNVRLLIIDDITYHFWIHKQNHPKLSFDQFSNQKLEILRSIIKNMNLVLLFSQLHSGDVKKSVNLHVDYKIVGAKSDTGKEFLMIDYVKQKTVKVPFELNTFINFI